MFIQYFFLEKENLSNSFLEDIYPIVEEMLFE